MTAPEDKSDRHQSTIQPRGQYALMLQTSNPYPYISFKTTTVNSTAAPGDMSGLAYY